MARSVAKASVIRKVGASNCWCCHLALSSVSTPNNIDLFIGVITKKEKCRSHFCLNRAHLQIERSAFGTHPKYCSSQFRYMCHSRRTRTPKFHKFLNARLFSSVVSPIEERPAARCLCFPRA